MKDKPGTKFLNTNNPRESIVVNDESSDAVIKTPVSKKPEYINNWLEKQRHARLTVNLLLKHPNKLGGYFVPKITEINDSIQNPYVREQRVHGFALTKEYFDSLSKDAQENIYKVLANFVYDMNHCRPVLTLQQKLANQSAVGLSFDDILNKITIYIDNQEILSVKNAYNFFQLHPEMTSVLVFFHGDMNQDNMFYDKETNTVSFIDFAEANYKTLEYVFDHDLIKLPWLNPETLIKYYVDLSKNDRNCIKSNPAILKLYYALNNFKWTAESIISGSGNKEVLKKILHENIKEITNAYSAIVIQLQQKVKTL